MGAMVPVTATPIIHSHTLKSLFYLHAINENLFLANIKIAMPTEEKVPLTATW
jgi:hypothetical protein